MERKYQIVLIILLFIILTFMSFLFSPFFNIRDFKIHSRSEINNNSLRGYLNQFYGKNILFIGEDELREELLKHNLISSIEIEKEFPSTIHIIVEERQAVAWIKNNEKKLLFSADGIILREENLNSDIKIPEIEGYPYFFKEDRIFFPQEISPLLSILNNLELSFLAEMQKILFNDNIYRLYLADGGGVNLGRNSNLEEKFALLNSILNNDIDKSEIDYINLQVPRHPVIKLK